MHKILIIDDDEMVLALTQSVLVGQGYATLSTADGPQGITIYKEQRPDLVLLDLGLPSMNGLEVLRKIRTFDPKARVIVITGYASQESEEVAVQYGACDFVRKPVDFTDFLRRIQAVLEA
jgi:CheY-like chemotaxis protein